MLKYVDQNGIEYRKHSFLYRYKGSSWTIPMWATSAEDAQERFKALLWAKYDGEIVAEFPVHEGLARRLARWFKRRMGNADG